MDGFLSAGPELETSALMRQALRQEDHRPGVDDDAQATLDLLLQLLASDLKRVHLCPAERKEKTLRSSPTISAALPCAMIPREFDY